MHNRRKSDWNPKLEVVFQCTSIFKVLVVSVVTAVDIVLTVRTLGHYESVWIIFPSLNRLKAIYHDHLVIFYSIGSIVKLNSFPNGMTVVE
jgi:hypothetical protein